MGGQASSAKGKVEHACWEKNMVYAKNNKTHTDLLGERLSNAKKMKLAHC